MDRRAELEKKNQRRNRLPGFQGTFKNVTERFLSCLKTKATVSLEAIINEGEEGVKTKICRERC